MIWKESAGWGRRTWTNRHGHTGFTYEQVGVVLQDAQLFSGTVRENIAYARPDATDAEVQEAAVLANAHKCV